jgi:hypothetical protein
MIYWNVRLLNPEINEAISLNQGIFQTRASAISKALRTLDEKQEYLLINLNDFKIITCRPMILFEWKL